MKMSLAVCLLLVTTATLSCASEDERKSETLAGSYLDQNPPGFTAELFAPGVVSTASLESQLAFSPDQTEIYFFRQKKGAAPKNYVIRFADGAWQTAVEHATGDGEVFISNNGQLMHQGNKFRRRTETGWSEEHSLGPDFEQYEIMRLTESAKGTFVFDEREETGRLRYSRIDAGRRTAPLPFGENINSGKWTAHPFIAPDESYLIWDSEREGGFGETDLYISFRQPDGSWGPAVNMGDTVNSKFEDTYGGVTPDGKYFFFNRINLRETFDTSEANIYWVNARFIEALRTQ